MQNAQLDLAFMADLPAPPAQTARAPRTLRKTATPRKPGAPGPSVPALGAPANNLEPTEAEAQARALEAHPDYRVLRRLPVRLQWPEAAAGAQLMHLLVLDTETTGLDASKDRIMELALLRVTVDGASGQPVGTVQVYDGLEDPGIPIPREVQDITGITPAMVRGQALDVARIVELLQGVDLVVAHNAGFDRPFVEARLPVFQDCAWACSVHDVPWKTHGRRSAKLENLALDLGWFYDAHRAEMDCHALLAVLSAPLGTRNALAGVLERARHPSYRLLATHAPFDAKDRLKARGYRWSTQDKVWSIQLPDSAALESEFAWLKDNAYQQRAAVVQFERLAATVRYSGRPGVLMHHQL